MPGWRRENGILPTWALYRSFGARGIQIGPFAACKAYFVLNRFQLLSFHGGEPILIAPELFFFKSVASMRTSDWHNSGNMASRSHVGRQLPLPGRKGWREIVWRDRRRTVLPASHLPIIVSHLYIVVGLRGWVKCLPALLHFSTWPCLDPA